MKRNLKLLLFAFILSIPVWWGIDLFSDTATKILLNWELKTNPEILAAHAAQETLEKKLQETHPLPTKGSDTLLMHARAVSSTLVRQDQTQKVLFEQNPDSPVLIASLTKLMTAFVAMESYPPTQEIIITPQILFTEGDSGQLKQWEIFTVRDLLYISLIESSNDAATALTVPMGYDTFIARMNTQAALLNMETASFTNPTGLDSVTANYASAQDLTKLAVYLKTNYPQIFDILSQQQFPVRTADGTFHHNLINTNELLGYREWPTKVLGGKTGWTPPAKQALVLIVESPNKEGYIVNVILGSDDRFGEMKKLLSWILYSYQWNH
jgi:serine-type D-Ala-D-Ala carboxypeptidase (penicillin-binding protein 5/6)